MIIYANNKFYCSEYYDDFFNYSNMAVLSTFLTVGNDD